MTYLSLEDPADQAELVLSLNGLPLAARTPIRSGDVLRAGNIVLRLVGDPAPGRADRLSEPDDPPYRAAASRPEGPSVRRDSPADPRPALGRSPELVAEAPAMRGVLARVRRIAGREASVLLLGESGVGKEVVARAIQASGPRSRRPFLSVNAAAVSESLLESELFGHERGAFTGATERRRGLFEAASSGTLFLDEVGELSPAIQAKLLRALEAGEIRRVGGAETIRIDVRLIAATNRDLRREVNEGRFRSDLYFRIAVVEIRIPPLRERVEDVEPLARQFLARLRESHGRPSLDLAPEALDALRAYPFPGNVRELRNILESAASFCDADLIRVEDLGIPSAPTRAPADGFVPLAEVERLHVRAALDRAGWNKSRAAELLGVDRKTLYAKIESFRIERSAPPDEGAAAWARALSALAAARARPQLACASPGS